VTTTTEVQTKRRLGLFQKGHYSDENLSSALDRAQCSGSPHVELTVWSAPGYEKPAFGTAIQGLRSEDARPFVVGDWLGPSWTNHWVKAMLRIPEHWAKCDDPVICKG
jgi:alpha-mannosidase